MSTFPTVATVIGVSKEVAESGPLLATLAIDPSVITTQAHHPDTVDIKTGDPVSQAVVDNIIGKLPTKKEPIKLRCEVCNITVSSQEILDTHYAGAKHARKLKGQELIKDIFNSPLSTYISSNGNTSMEHRAADFTCKICNVRLNSEQQLQQHLTGSKHKNKMDSSQSNSMQVSVSNNGYGGVVDVDIGPNRLYCAACNVHVNSDLQLHQHVTSTKHANKVNGRAPTGNYRGSPYTRRTTQSGRGANNGTTTWKSNKPAGAGGGWTPSNNSMGLVNSSWPRQHTANVTKPFVSGGMLYDQSV